MSALNAFDNIWPGSTPAPTPQPITAFDSPLKDKAIIVTGCASGIGRAVALYLAEQGVRLALTDLDAKGGRELCGEIKESGLKNDMVFAALDCTDEIAVGKLVRTFKKSYKRLDGLVNCAGVNLPPRESSSIDQVYFDTTMDTNLKGTWAFCKHFGIAAKKDLENDEVDPPEGGYSIVNIGSNASLMGIEYTSIYCASKHAILGLSRSLALEFAPSRIRVNVVAPGPIDTPLLHSHFAGSEQEDNSLDDLVEKVPMKRLGRPEEVASVVGFLLDGTKSGFVTGAVIPVDGGLTA